MEEGSGTPVPLRRISTADLASYRHHLIRVEKLRAASVNRKVQALKRFFAWAEQKKLIPANPASALRLLRRQKRLQPAGLATKKCKRCYGPRARPDTASRGATTPCFS